MKKTYFQPQIKVVNINAQNTILAGSDLRFGRPTDVQYMKRGKFSKKDIEYYESEDF